MQNCEEKSLQDFRLPVNEVSSCCHCLAKLAKLSATPPIKSTQRPVRLKAKRTFKKRPNNAMPTLISDLKPDDLPQVDGFCCGHSYLKLSDARACACLCPQCIGKYLLSRVFTNFQNLQKAGLNTRLH